MSTQAFKPRHDLMEEVIRRMSDEFGDAFLENLDFYIAMHGEKTIAMYAVIHTFAVLLEDIRADKQEQIHAETH